MKEIEGEKSVMFGKRKKDGANIYIKKPAFQCGWYWGFGYLGNRSEHYHLKNYSQKEHFLTLEGGERKLLTEDRNTNMYDALMEDYDLSESISNNLWLFCELVLSAYTLIGATEVLGRGGSHYCENPHREVIKNAVEVKRINEVVLPAIFAEIQKIVEGGK